MGLAVIATDVGGTKEIIDHSKNGYLIKPGDVKELSKRLSALLKNESLRKKVGSSLQKKVRMTFDWDKVVEKFEKVVKSL